MNENVYKILNFAASFIGYKEGSNNNNKFGVAYGLNNQPWCVIFIWYLFNMTGLGDLFYGGGKIALCSALFNYHKKLGQQVSTDNLKSGDVVFFDFSGKKKDTSHVGIVESVGSGFVITIEGNTSSGQSGSQSNGDGVYRRTRSLSYVTCAYRPKYGNDEPVKPVTTAYPKDLFITACQRLIGANPDGKYGPETKSKLPLITTSKNSKHPVVAVLQAYTFALGYMYEDSSCDGDYGRDSASVIYAIQKQYGLKADGECGPDTWALLMK